MKTTIPALAAFCLALGALAGDAAAQQTTQPPGAGQAQPPQQGRSAEQAEEARTPELTLVYEREVFLYHAAGRRDPFRPLTEEDELGPRFEHLSLQGIIYSTGLSRSLALLADKTGRVHRVREGDVVGNARVVEIGPTRVVMAVETFGRIRQELLELQRRGGAQR